MGFMLGLAAGLGCRGGEQGCTVLWHVHCTTRNSETIDVDLYNLIQTS